MAGLARAALARGAGVPALAALLEQLDAAVAAALASRPDGAPRPACGPGCAACCTLNVGTLAVEGAVAAEWLRARCTDGEARSVAASLLAFHERVRWLEDAERISARLACPLLDEAGRCTIHPVRPLACRSVSSLDAGECRSALGVAQEEPPVVRMDLMQLELYADALAILRNREDEAGLDARSRDVSGMVGAFLADAALARRWLAGDRVPLD